MLAVVVCVIKDKVQLVSHQAFPKENRLLTSRDFSSVFEDASVKAPHSQLLLLARPNNLPNPRLGLVIAKKNVRLASQRNRIKRVLREQFRQHQPDLCGLDIIALARRGIDQLHQPQLNHLVIRQLNKLSRKFNQQRPL